LLHRIGKSGFLVAADFSTILSMDERCRARILAQLRRIYDGHFTREFGTEENSNQRDWKGRLTFITGATPDIDRHYLVFRELGERFIQVRWPRAGGIEAGIKAMRLRRNASEDLRKAMHQFLLPILTRQSILPPHFTEEFELRVAHLGEFVALARAQVPRERFNHEPITAPCPEGNTRLPQQFAQVGRGAALLAGRERIMEPDFALVRRAAFDCIPATRSAVLRAILAEQSPYSTGISSSLVSRTIEDLQALSLVESNQPLMLTLHAERLLEGAKCTFPQTAHERDEGKSG